MSWFQKLFGYSRGVAIGMLHVPALPGTPSNTLPLPTIIKKVSQEAQGYVEAGITSLMLENMHDVPYVRPDKVGPEITASMSAVSCAIRQQHPDLPLGVQILSAANKQALAVALAAGLDFIRAEGFVFGHIGDEGYQDACAGELLRYRRLIGADHIKILTDIKKKHSSHSITSDVSISETAKAAEFFLSDGIIVTGTSTGCPTSPDDVKEVRSAVALPVLVGSGVTMDTAKHDRAMLEAASGYIVGSYFKHDGWWENELDLSRVEQFMREIKRFQV